MQQNLIDRNKLLEDRFEVKLLRQHIYEKDTEEDKENIKKKKKKVLIEVNKTVLKVKNATAFAANVLEYRKIDLDNSVVQVGIDDGQSVVKILVTCKENGEEEQSKKKVKYSEGFGGGDFKNS